MKIFKIEKKRILLYVLLILGFIGIALFAFSDLSTIQNYKDRISEEKEEEQDDNQEEEKLAECTAEQLPDLFDRPDKIEVITSDDDNHKVILTAATLPSEAKGDVVGCYADLTKGIADALGEKVIEPFYITNSIYLGDGSIAYNYEGMIYIQQLTGEGSIKPIFDKKITSSETWEALGPFMYGPYLVYGETNGKAYESFLFTVDYVWGCEQDSDEEYCSQMSEITKRFCNVEKIPGIWEYDIKTGKTTPIKTEDCNF